MRTESKLTAIRMPEDMRERAEKAAKDRGLKFSQVMRLALAEWLARQEVR